MQHILLPLYFVDWWNWPEIVKLVCCNEENFSGVTSMINLTWLSLSFAFAFFWMSYLILFHRSFKRGSNELSVIKNYAETKFYQSMYFFSWCDVPHLAVFITFCYFSAIQWSIFFHLVFRWSRDLNPQSRTMAWIVSHQRSPLDQGALRVPWLVIETYSS